MRARLVLGARALLASAALLAPLTAHAQTAPPTKQPANPAPAMPTPTAVPISDAADAALIRLEQSAPAAAALVVETDANSNAVRERREITLTSDRRLATLTRLAPPTTTSTTDATSPAPAVDADGWLRRPESYTFVDAELVRFNSKTGEGNRYHELERQAYWSKRELPMQVRMCPWPLLGDVVMGMRTDPNLEVQRDEPTGDWTATSPAQHTEVVFDGDGLLREFRQLGVGGARAQSYVFVRDGAGALTQILDHEFPPPAPATPLVRPEEQRPPDNLVRDVAPPPIPTPSRTITWRVVSHTTQWADPAQLETALRFDPRALDVLKWNTITGELTDADGKVVGVDKVPAIAAMDSFFKKKQEQETKAMRQNPHGVPMSKWIWWLAGAALLCVVVDQIRRRL